MFHRIISVVAFYRDDGKILIQDRTNMNTDADWGLFGGGREGEENEKKTAIREIKEELNIDLTESDLTRIGFTVVEKIEISRYDVTIFIAKWKNSYESVVQIGEGAGMHWITPKEMRQLPRIYHVDILHMDIVESYFAKHSISFHA